MGSRSFTHVVSEMAMKLAVRGVMELIPRAPGIQMEISDAEAREVVEGGGWRRVHFTFKYRPLASGSVVQVPK